MQQRIEWSYDILLMRWDNDNPGWQLVQRYHGYETFERAIRAFWTHERNWSRDTLETAYRVWIEQNQYDHDRGIAYAIHPTTKPFGAMGTWWF